MKVYVEQREFATESMFKTYGYEVVNTVDEADVVCFIGGADVSPALYLEKNVASHCNAERDIESVGLYNRAKYLGLVCAGICRGGQFLNVMNGGRMEQHIGGHAGRDHVVNIVSGESFPEYVGQSFLATSTHHQGILPTEDADLIAVAPDGNVEVVIYRDSGDLCFQPHPEYSGADACRGMFFNLLEELD